MALAEAAKAGNQAAIKAIEVFLRDEGEGPSPRADYGRLSISQLAELFGVTRQTVYDWYTKQGLARNADSTFDLKVAIRWFEEFTLKKVSKGKEILGDPDPLRTIRARKLALDLERQRGQLLDRETVIAGQVARFANLIEALEKLCREVAMMVVNQPAERIREILETWKNDVIVAQRQVPEELQLTPPAAGKLGECLAMVAEK
jgi:phage terminase Nu1 subunit (DNA packaging protein)